MAGAAGSTSVTKPGCGEKCGNVTIPYPFGIGGNCYHESWYEIFCNNSFSPPKPFLRRFNLEVMEITLTSPDASLPLLTVGTPPLNICTSGVVDDSSLTLRSTSADLGGSPYRFSTDFNVFMVEGCASSVVMMNRSNEILAGCASICPNNHTFRQNYCYGVGCCQSSIPIKYSLDFYQIGFYNEALPISHTCVAAALVADTSVKVDDFRWSGFKYVKRLSSGDPFPTQLECMVKDNFSYADFSYEDQNFYAEGF